METTAQQDEGSDPAVTPLVELSGVGPLRAERLAALGVRTIKDLLCTLPRRVDEWPRTVSIATLLAAPPPQPCVVAGRVLTWRLSRFSGRSSLRCRIADDSGELELLFFNQPWLRHKLAKDQGLEVLGKLSAAGAFVVSRASVGGAPLPRAGELVATYPSAEGLSATFVRELILRALSEHGARLREPLPLDELVRRGLEPLPRAVNSVHAPRSLAEYERARRRVALEPLIAAQRRLAASRAAARALGARALEVSDARFDALLASLPFTLTRGQLELASELRADLARQVPMRRLLQGDVGSGKTVLGALACAIAAASGAQAAFVAPTELLAEQHFAGLEPLLRRAGVSCALLTGGTGARERRERLTALRDGELQVVIGTHALMQERVDFARLALAVIDEQHRFGVAQRDALLDKGVGVHGLLMTATPIPRSLALTVYGDLDVSLLREKPPGRARVTTHWVREVTRSFESQLEERLERGEQLYWVVPRIESSREEGADGEEAQAAIGAEERFERIAARRWSRYGVELVHGRIEREERAARLERFRRGTARILVATTVIEVGVDVPQASAIVVEHAERLGLAQLHQLRGRVGRGAVASVCYLLGKPSARKRLELLERSDDGFEIAEADLAERGMGDLTGLRQAGDNREGFEDPELDLELVLLARDLVRDSAQATPTARLC